MEAPFLPGAVELDRRSRTLIASCRGVLASALSLIAEVILRIWSASWRKDTDQILQLDRLLATGTPVLAVFWHGKYLPLFALAEGRNATVFIGRSFRGEVIARICRQFGFEAVLIPAHSVHTDAYEIMLQRLRTAKFGVLAVDGPLGPYHKVRSGAVRLASENQLLIVPISVASDRKSILRWRWDQQELPHPFATVALAVGEPIKIPQHVTQTALSDWSNVIQARLEAVDAEAKARVCIAGESRTR